MALSGLFNPNQKLTVVWLAGEDYWWLIYSATKKERKYDVLPDGDNIIFIFLGLHCLVQLY